MLALTGGAARIVSDNSTINNSQSAAYNFTGFGGTEVIYTTGNNAVGFNNGIVVGGALTPIGVH